MEEVCYRRDVADGLADGETLIVQGLVALADRSSAALFRRLAKPAEVVQAAPWDRAGLLVDGRSSHQHLRPWQSVSIRWLL